MPEGAEDSASAGPMRVGLCWCVLLLVPTKARIRR
jgi:hypothetical protein